MPFVATNIYPKTLKGIRDRAILILLWGNALRRSEIVNTDIRDYSPSLGELVITGKGRIGQPETISLGKGAIAAIDNWLVSRGNIVFTHGSLKFMSCSELKS